MAAFSITFGQRLVESIWSKGADALVENAYDKHRAIDVLVNRGRGFKKPGLAGVFVGVPTNLRKMNISQQVLEGAEYSLLNVETFNELQYPYVTTVTPLVFTDEELGENQMKAKVIDTVKSRMEAARNDHVEIIDLNLFRGTGTAPSPESLNTIVGTGTLGGISPTTYPLWVSTIDSTTTALATTAMDKNIDKTMFSATQGVDFIFSGQSPWQRYKEISRGMTQVFQTADSQKPDAGFTGIEVVTFRGATWFWDRHCPDVSDPLGVGDTTNYMYFIDSSNLRWFVQEGRDMRPFPKKESVLALSSHIPIVSRYAFAPLARRAHAKMTGLTS